MRICAIFLFILMMTSCAHMQSGSYVVIEQPVSLQELAELFNVSAKSIKNANPRARFRVGEKVFIPKARVGILNQISGDHPTIFDMPKLAGGLVWPVPASKRISSKYGRRKGKNHDGIDIPAPRGSHILSVAKGVVIYSGSKISGYGKMTIVKHSEDLYSVYAHAHKLFVKKGDRVEQGQVIAQVGSTGKSTGPHLHFEIRKNEVPIDPLKFLHFKQSQVASRN